MKKLILLLILSCANLIAISQYTITTYDGSPVTPDPKKINLLILADGYKTISGDLNTGSPQFNADADDFIAELIGVTPYTTFPGTSPYREYRNYFKIFKVYTESAYSGAAHPYTANCGESGNPSNTTSITGFNTAFGSSFDNGTPGSVAHRLLKSDYTAIANFINNTFNPGPTPIPNLITATMVLVNTAEYGGAGSASTSEIIATACTQYSNNQPCSISPYCNERIAVHEFTHAFAKVLDEYYTTGTAVAANRDNAASGSQSTWDHWMYIPGTTTSYPSPDIPTITYNPHRNWTVACGTGGITTNSDYATGSNTTVPAGLPANVANIWKPTTGLTGIYDDGTANPAYTGGRCKMENVSQPLCSVCKEAIIERIHDLVNPVLTTSPAENLITTSINLTSGGSQTFNLTVLEPIPIPTTGTNPKYMRVEWYLGNTLKETDNSPPWEYTVNCASGLTSGNNMLTAKVIDVTGTTVDLTNATNDNRLVRKPSHTTNHVTTKTWYIKAYENLMIRDFNNQPSNTGPLTDIGDEPWNPFPLDGWYFDYTSDIKISSLSTGTDLDAIIHEVPVVGTTSPYYVYVRVKNIGCAAYAGETDKLRLYASVNGSGTSWNDGLWSNNVNGNGYEITAGNASDIPAIASGAETTIKIPWNSIPWSTTLANTLPCLMAQLDGVTNDLINVPQTDLTNLIRFNNNIAMLNLTTHTSGELVVEIGGKPYRGSYTYMGNTKSVADTFDISVLYGLQKIGSKAITNEAEVIIFFKETGWDVSNALNGTLSKGLTRLDSTLFLASDSMVTFDHIIIPADTVIPVFIGFAFLTEELGDSTNYVLHLEQKRSSKPDTVFWSHHYQIERNPSRTLFTADAGANQDVVLGDTITLTADNIGEDALYIWHDKTGAVVGTGLTLCIVPDTTMDYKLEVIAEADGYKDYDQVNVKVSKGQITSIVPNPASTTTLVYYRTSSVTTAKIKVVAVSTFTEVDNFTVTAGTGTKSIDISGYTTGAYIITLEGDTQNLDSETLIVE